MTCSNCGSKHGCGCQARVASDGKSVCSTCIGTYETKIKNTPKPTPPPPVKGIFFNPKHRT